MPKERCPGCSFSGRALRSNSSCGDRRGCASDCVLSLRSDLNGGTGSLRTGGDFMTVSPPVRPRVSDWLGMCRENRMGGGGATKAGPGRGRSSRREGDFKSDDAGGFGCHSIQDINPSFLLAGCSWDISGPPTRTEERFEGLDGTELVGGVLASKSKSEGRTVRVLVVLAADSPLGVGRAGSGRQPAGSEANDVGRDDDSAMDVGRDEAGGVGGMAWNEARLCVRSRMRSSKIRRSPRMWE